MLPPLTQPSSFGHISSYLSSCLPRTKTRSNCYISCRKQILMLLQPRPNSRRWSELMERVEQFNGRGKVEYVCKLKLGCSNPSLLIGYWSTSNPGQHRRRQPQLQPTSTPAMASKLLPHAFRHCNRSIRPLPLQQCRAFTATPQIFSDALFVVSPVFDR
jgi:hypothetical protein